MKILHVDDSLDDRVLTKMKLERVSDKICIEGVDNVDEAYSAIGKGNFDCVLSDYQMPGQDGATLLKKLRNNNNNIPFIFYTGQGNEELAIEAFRAGADDYFTKEVGFAHYERLVNSIERIVEYYQQFLVRRKEREDLRKSQRRLIKAQRLARMSSWEWDFRADRFYCSDEFFNILGFEKLNNQDDKSFILGQFPESEGYRFKRDVLNVMRGQEITQKEYSILNNKHEELTLLISMAPVKEPGSVIVERVEGVVQDVTERKAVEKQVAKHKERLSQAHQLGELGSWELDLSTYTVRLSDIARNIFDLGESSKKLTPSMIRNRALPQYRSVLDRAMKDLIAGKQPYNVQFEIYSRNPERTRTIHSIGKADFDENGKAVRVIGTIQDITRLRSIEKEQEEHQRRLKDILFGFGAPLAEVDEDGTLTDQNLLFQNTFRSEGTENLSEIFPDFLELFKGGGKQKGHKSFRARAYNAKSYHLDSICISFNYETKLKYLVIISDTDGTDPFFSGISEKKSDFSVLKEFLPVGLYKTDGQGRYLYANETLAHILGCRSVEELKRINANEFYLDANDRQKKLNNWIVRDEVTSNETKFKTRQGRVIWVRESGTVYLRQDGSIDYIIGLLEDITEKKNSEFVQSIMHKIASEANRSGDIYDLFSSIHHHLGQLIDTSNFYIAIYEGDDNYFFPYDSDVNDKALNERMTIRKGLTSLVQKRGKPLLVDSSEIKSMEAQGLVEMVGTPAACWMGVPLFSEEKTIGVMAVQNYYDMNKYSEEDLDIFTFISGQVANAIERKIQEKKLISQRDELARTNKELESFSYTVSHDLKAPLRHITGYCSLLSDCLDSDEITDEYKYFQGIQAAAERMESLINDILSLTRSSSLEMNKMDIDLSEISNEVINANGEEIKRRGIKFNVESGLKTRGDYRMMHIVMENLIGNAIKFTGKQESPEIYIGREQFENRDCFYIKDNGAGFDQNQSEKVFLAFERLHSDKDFQGTGIGLATVKKIIERHGGSIWAASVKGQGATFYFFLPPYEEINIDN